VLVVNVDQDGPAGSVGLAIGDYLMGLDRRVVMTPEDAIATLMRYAPRTTVIMTVWRQGKTLTQPVVLGTQQAFPDQVAEDPRPYLAAATRMDATPKILTALGLELANTQSGPQIVSVDLGSPAEGIGLRKSDVILGIDGVKTANAAAVTEAIRKQPADNNLTFTVLRDGRQKNLTLRLNQPPVSAPTVPTGNNSASQ
jgi:serine protease Do